MPDPHPLERNRRLPIAEAIDRAPAGPGLYAFWLSGEPARQFGLSDLGLRLCV